MAASNQNSIHRIGFLFAKLVLVFDFQRENDRPILNPTLTRVKRPLTPPPSPQGRGEGLQSTIPHVI